MGSRGPVPKRSDQRAGHHAKSDKADKVTKQGPAKMPAPSKLWHPEARRWYRSLDESGQSYWFEPSDWATARVIAAMLSALLKSSRPSSEMFKGCMAAMDNLGSTEGARRRMRIEVERDRPSRGNNPNATEDATEAVVTRLAELRAVSAGDAS